MNFSQLSKLEELITKSANAAFDCGEADFTSDDYKLLLNKSVAARLAIVDYVKQVVDEIDKAERL